MKNLLHRPRPERRQYIFFTETPEQSANYKIENDTEAQNVTREITDAEIRGIVDSIARLIGTLSPAKKNSLTKK